MGTMPLGAALEMNCIGGGYSAKFRCIGPECEDTCCVGWSVFFDEAACAKYEALPAGPLKALLQCSVERFPPKGDGTVGAQFARVRMGEDRRCPMLTGQKLCRIQAELGHAHLSNTCAQYPRVAQTISGVEDAGLSLSCPEAARLVLLSENLMMAEAKPGSRFHCKDGEAGVGGPVDMLGYFWPIREFVLRLLTNRHYPLWQRLFLLGIFTRRMQALARGELGREFGIVLREFAGAIESGSLRESMGTIAADLHLQLDFVLRMAGMRLSRTHVNPRFQEIVDAFVKGIGNGPGATMETLIGGYAEAYERWYEPFFRRYPHMLENLLINTVVRLLFPFGRKDGGPTAAPDMEREFALLASQFALVKGLLIGVAGFYRETFCAEHVVKTVQSASRHFEHHPQFLDQAYGLLLESGRANARGLAMLVRN